MPSQPKLGGRPWWEARVTPGQAGTTPVDSATTGDGMSSDDDELAVLFAAWREDIDSVPAPALVVLQATLILNTNSPCSSDESQAL